MRDLQQRREVSSDVQVGRFVSLEVEFRVQGSRCGGFQSPGCCSVLQYFAVCCSALQCADVQVGRFVSLCSGFRVQGVAVSCSVLQCVAAAWLGVQASGCCSVLQCAAVCCSVLQCVAVCCSVLQCIAVCCSELQCVPVCFSVFQFVAVCVAWFRAQGSWFVV